MNDVSLEELLIDDLGLRDEIEAVRREPLAKYDPSQARAPKGSTTGGQWISDSGDLAGQLRQLEGETSQWSHGEGMLPLSESKFDSPEAVPDTIEKEITRFAEEFLRAEVEHGRGFDVDPLGEVLVKSGLEVTGDKAAIALTRPQIDSLNRGVFLHNHPSGNGTLSPSDVKFASVYGLRAMVAVGAGTGGEPPWMTIAMPPEGGWIDYVATQRAIDALEIALVNREIKQRTRAYTPLESEQRASAMRDTMWRMLAQRGVLRYARVPLDQLAKAGGPPIPEPGPRQVEPTGPVTLDGESTPIDKFVSDEE